MDIKLDKIVHRYLPRIGYWLENSSNKSDVLSLIKRLIPMSTDKSLIRLGPSGDGGYLVPNDMEGIEACFSPGVGHTSDFEAACVKKFGLKVFLADYSVKQPPLMMEEFTFIKKFVGSVTNQNFITLDDWIESSEVETDSDLMLQMDIEGHEYHTILSTATSILKRFRIIIIEFHSLQRIWNSEFFPCVSNTFDKLLQNHTCVHIHPNNCCGIFYKSGVGIPRVAEITFLRNDRISFKEPQTLFPHPLDIDNFTGQPISLPKNWYT